MNLNFIKINALYLWLFHFFDFHLYSSLEDYKVKIKLNMSSASISGEVVGNYDSIVVSAI